MSGRRTVRDLEILYRTWLVRVGPGFLKFELDLDLLDFPVLVQPWSGPRFN